MTDSYLITETKENKTKTVTDPFFRIFKKKKKLFKLTVIFLISKQVL